MNGGRPVAQVLSPVIARILALTLAMAVVAMLGVFLTTRSVQSLSEELQPAASANQNILAELGDLRAATREWVVAGRPAARADYEAAEEQLTADLQTVADLSSDDAELERLLARQEQAAQAWVDDYGAVVISRPGGSGTFDRQLFTSGVGLFDNFREAHDDTTAAFQSRIDEMWEDWILPGVLRIKQTPLGRLPTSSSRPQASAPEPEAAVVGGHRG